MKSLRSLMIGVLVIVAASGVFGATPKVDTPRISGFFTDPVKTDQCTPVRVGIGLMNATEKPISSQQPYSGTTYSIFQSFAGKGMSAVRGKYMLAVSLNDGKDGYPYRWGFRGELRPGRTTTVMGYLSIPATGRYRICAVLMNGESVVEAAGTETSEISVSSCAPQQENAPQMIPGAGKYYLNGTPYSDEGPPVVSGGHLMVPADTLAYNIGGSLFLAQNGVIISNGQVQMVLFPNSQYAYVNGSPVTLPVPPSFYGNRLYLPPRYVCPFFGSSVYWDPFGRSVFIEGSGY